MYRGIKLMGLTPMILVIKMERLIRHGCEAYLIFVTINMENKVKLYEILVVWDFSYVFPNELPKLLPQREINFSIELIRGMEPISKAPYKMVPNELKELKTQL